MNTQKKTNLKKKLVLSSIILFAPGLIAQLIILQLLQKQIISTMLALILTLLAVSSVFAFVLITLMQLILPIKAAINGENIESNTKLAVRAKKIASREDELGELFRTIINTTAGFAHTIATIKSATEELSAVSEEFAQMFDSMDHVMANTSDAVDNITSTTNVQADKTYDIKAKTDAIATAIDHILQNVEVLSHGAQTVSECNQTADKILGELLAISNENSAAIESVKEQTEKTNQSVQEIRSVTEIIAGISRQTNMLALNASIEAARAGTHGSGFAVVAEQIRTLADQSQASTEHINQIVNDLIENSDISVNITNKVSETFSKQDEKMQDTKEIFTTLNKEIQNVSTAINGISTEISGLENHKNIIAQGVDNLATFAEENANYGEKVNQDMYDLKSSMLSCNEATDKIVEVSEELVSEIQKFQSIKKFG